MDQHEHDPSNGVVNIFGLNISNNDLKRLIFMLAVKRRSPRRRSSKRQRLDGIEAILGTLPAPVPIKKIILRGNGNIGDAGMKYLHLLPTSIETLNLASCGLTHEGIKVLCNYMKTNTTITDLLVWGNAIGDEGARHIADMLRVNKTLQSLNLSNYTSIGPEGLRHLAEGLAANDTLNSLILFFNYFEDGHLQSLFQGLYTNRGLETINLTDALQDATPVGYQSILECLRNNHYLTTIDGLRDDPAVPEIRFFLRLNAIGGRQLVADENASLSNWLDRIIVTSTKDDVSFSYFFLRSKPELCMHSASTTTTDE